MTEDMTVTNGNKQPQKKKGMSGCLIAILIAVGVLIIAGGVTAFIVYKSISTVKDTFVKKYAENFESHTAQSLTFSDFQSGDHVYFAQAVDFSGDNDGSLTFVTQTTKISGDITGDVALMTQTCTIEESATIGGDLHFMGQTIVIKGYVDGEISGTAQSITIREDLQHKLKATYETMKTLPAPEPTEHEDMNDDEATDESSYEIESEDEMESDDIN